MRGAASISLVACYLLHLPGGDDPAQQHNNRKFLGAKVKTSMAAELTNSQRFITISGTPA